MVELMIALALLSILAASAMSVMTSMVAASTGADRRVNITAESQLVMDAITRAIRAASYAGEPLSPIFIAGDDELWFYASLNPNETGDGPVMIELSVSGCSAASWSTCSGHTLVETEWNADLSSGGVGWTYTGTPWTQTLATDLDPSHGPLFYYYPLGVNAMSDASGYLTTPLDQEPSNATAAIDSVRIDLWVDPEGQEGMPAVQDTTTVHLVNVDYTNSAP